MLIVANVSLSKCIILVSKRANDFETDLMASHFCNRFSLLVKASATTRNTHKLSYGAFKMAYLQAKSPLATADVFVFFEPKENEAADCEEEGIIRVAMQMKEDGNNCVVAKDYEKALESYNAAIAALISVNVQKCRHELAICYQNLAYVYELLGKFTLVIEYATKAIEIDEVYAKAYFRRARAYVVERQPYSAFQDIVRACVLSKFLNKSYIKMMMDMNSKFGKYTICLVSR